MKGPSKRTLDKYGLTRVEYWGLFHRQYRACAVCRSEGRLVIDHEHVKGWKRMKPEDRRKHVRGLLCWRCNYHFAGKGMNEVRAWRLYNYMMRHRCADSQTSS